MAKTLAIVSFLLGLLLWVRVMFFGVRRVEQERLSHRTWPLAGAAFFLVAGAVLYAVSRRDAVTAGEWAAVALSAITAAVIAGWVVRRSAAIPSTDPDDDPRYRFQGHVARITEAIGGERGRVAFDFDGTRYEFRARWSPAAELPEQHDALAAAGAEVVIETIDDDVAYVEPWTLVEARL